MFVTWSAPEQDKVCVLDCLVVLWSACRSSIMGKWGFQLGGGGGVNRGHPKLSGGGGFGKTAQPLISNYELWRAKGAENFFEH